MSFGDIMSSVGNDLKATKFVFKGVKTVGPGQLEVDLAVVLTMPEAVEVPLESVLAFFKLGNSLAASPTAPASE
jgi:hypothetical protein